MFKQLADWYKYRFKDPNLSVLFLLLIAAFLVFYFFGNILAPLFVALVLSYLLDWPITYLMRYKINRAIATFIVMALFLSLAVFAFLGVLPTVFKQGAALVRDLPAMFNHVQDYVLTLPSKYPEAIDPVTITQIVENLRTYLLDRRFFIIAIFCFFIKYCRINCLRHFSAVADDLSPER
jgi:putative permease